MSVNSEYSYTDWNGHVTTVAFYSVDRRPAVESGLDAGAEGTRTEPAPREQRGIAAAPSACGPRGPILTHTFAFRLRGSERAAASRAITPSELGAAEGIVAITKEEAYLTRDGEATGTTVDIRGVETHAELGEGGIVCTAQVSDFAEGDLVVVRVEVALY